MRRSRRSPGLALVAGAAFTLALAACLIGPNPNYPLTGGADGGGGTSSTSTGDASTSLDASTGASTSTGPLVDESTGTTGGAAATTAVGTTSTSGDVPCEETAYDEYADDGRLGLVFVVDRSASMAKLWDHDADPNTAPIPRWVSVRHAVEQIAARFDLTTRAGLSLVPATAATNEYGPPACLVESPADVEPAPMNAAAVAAALPPADATPAGARPASTAIASAIAALDGLVDPPALRKQILLVTSGGGNCHPAAKDNPTWLLEGYDDTIHGMVGVALEQDKIFTHVIGVALADAVSPALVDSEPDGINPLTKLALLAEQGGTNKLWNVDGEAGLVAALDASVRSALRCEVTLDAPPSFPDLVQIDVAGKSYLKQGSCGGANGFAYPGEYKNDYGTLELCGEACARFQEVGVVKVQQFCQAG